MHVTLYRKPGCQLCKLAVNKLKLLGVAFAIRDLEKALELHEGWGKDGTAELRAGHAMIFDRVPLIVIDGWPFDYAGAMREVKSRQRSEECSRCMGTGALQSGGACLFCRGSGTWVHYIDPVPAPSVPSQPPAKRAKNAREAKLEPQWEPVVSPTGPEMSEEECLDAIHTVSEGLGEEVTFERIERTTYTFADGAPRIAGEVAHRQEVMVRLRGFIGKSIQVHIITARGNGYRGLAARVERAFIEARTAGLI